MMPAEEPTCPGGPLCTGYKHMLIVADRETFDAMTAEPTTLSRGALRFRSAYCLDCGAPLLRLEGLK